MLGEMNRPTPLLFLSIGAVIDFAFGCVKWHAVFAGVVAIVCGLALDSFAVPNSFGAAAVRIPVPRVNE